MYSHCIFQRSCTEVYITYYKTAYKRVWKYAERKMHKSEYKRRYDYGKSVPADGKFSAKQTAVQIFLHDCGNKAGRNQCQKDIYNAFPIVPLSRGMRKSHGIKHAEHKYENKAYKCQHDIILYISGFGIFHLHWCKSGAFLHCKKNKRRQ